MANRSDPFAQAAHGLEAQNLVSYILRNRIYAARYWKERCFGLTAESLVDQAIKLDCVGGIYSHNAKPTAFMCLTLKLLQIQPEQAIVLEYLKQEEYKYLRALGAFYLRLTARPADVYTYLEPLLADYRKVVTRSTSGWGLTHMDEFIDELLTGTTSCDVSLPRLPKRDVLESTGALDGPRVSPLEDLLEGGLMLGGTHAGAGAGAEVELGVEAEDMGDGGGEPSAPVTSATAGLLAEALAAAAASGAVMSAPQGGGSGGGGGGGGGSAAAAPAAAAAPPRTLAALEERVRLGQGMGGAATEHGASGGRRRSRSRDYERGGGRGRERFHERSRSRDRRRSRSRSRDRYRSRRDRDRSCSRDRDYDRRDCRDRSRSLGRDRSRDRYERPRRDDVQEGGGGEDVPPVAKRSRWGPELVRGDGSGVGGAGAGANAAPAPAPAGDGGAEMPVRQSDGSVGEMPMSNAAARAAAEEAAAAAAGAGGGGGSFTRPSRPKYAPWPMKGGAKVGAATAAGTVPQQAGGAAAPVASSAPEGSREYWDAQRAALGLAPLAASRR